MICSQCTEQPPCTNQREMRARHGLPAYFALAIWRAERDGDITEEEAQRAVNRYYRDYQAAPE